MNGIICINKPKDWTSFDVVAKFRGIARTKKCGHTGTLDPMATGVLPILLGNATKLSSLIPDSDKGYRAGFQLGVTTDTLDATGTVLSTVPVQVSLPQLEAALASFRGTIQQVPPMYSAVQVNGQRLYDLARNGQTVERPSRTVTIHQLDLLDYDPKTGQGTLEVFCSKGTYIRSLVDDLGTVLGCGGMLTSLVRSKANGFTLDDCLTLEECQQLADSGALESRVLPADRVLEELPMLRLNRVQGEKFQHGVKLDLNRLKLPKQIEGNLRVYNETGLFLGLARCDLDAEELVIVKLLAVWQEVKEG